MAGKKKHRESESIGQTVNETKGSGSTKPMLRIQKTGEYSFVIAVGDRHLTEDASWFKTVKEFRRFGHGRSYK